MAAKLVAPGHLKIKDETLGGVHPKSALNDSKTDPKRGGKKGGKKGALNDSKTNPKRGGKKGGKKGALNDSKTDPKRGGKKGGKKGALNDSKTNPKRGGKKGALYDSDTTNHKSPQPAEASWKEEDINVDEDIPSPRCMCDINQKEPSEWMKIKMSYYIVHEIPVDYQLLELEEEEHIKSIQEQQQIKEVPLSPQHPFLESIEPTDPEEDARWLEWTSAACREYSKASIDRETRALLGNDYKNH